MKHPSILGLVAFILSISLFFSGSGMAAEKASKDECVEKCKLAAQFVKDVGIEKALKVLNDPKGKFVWKDTYVFAIDAEKRINIAHPVKPALNNKGWVMTVKDVNGRMFFADFVKTANSPGQGWVNYLWPKPGEKEPSPKATYIYRVEGTPYAVGAGVYE